MFCLYTRRAMIPVYFINLDKDTDRLQHIQRVLSDIFLPEQIHRISGVVHTEGKHGCRLAHIRAHTQAISHGHPYYLICEDDLTPLTSDSKEIVRFIQDSISARPSLVLFEQAEGIESRVRMHASDGRPHLYRILGGGQGTGCYLCSRQFGIQLIELWTRVTKRHIDYSWQQLWESNDVYFHRPQLFIQRAGNSNQNDVGWRAAQRPFDWDYTPST